MTTIRDVARIAGVSVSTVSRVISDDDRVSPETRARVQQIVTELGYVPSAVARGLVSKETRLLGVVVSDISNPFYPQVLRGIEDVADRAGYTILTVSTDDELDRHARAVSALLEQRVDGLLLCSARLDDAALRQAVPGLPPTVLVNRSLSLTGMRLNEVILENVGAAELATRHLLEIGRRKLVHLAGPAYAQNARDRMSGYERAAAAWGIPAQDAQTIEVGFHSVADFEAMRAILRRALAVDDPPTAVFAVDDIIGMRMMEIAILELGLRVPEDVAVVGFDDSHVASSAFVQLSTVSHRPYEMGERAAGRVLEMISGIRADTPESVVLEPQLIVRRSTVSDAAPSLPAVGAATA
jgi:LacI family transcriptional regulator